MSIHSISSNTNKPISITVEGVEEVQKELNRMSKELQDRVAYEMMLDVGNHVHIWMQQEILEQGLLKNGDLFRSIRSEATTTDEGAEVIVGPDRALVPYADIQNEGGDIYPGAKGYLLFEGDKGWRKIVRVKKNGKPGKIDHVHIPARPYIEPAFEEHRDEILEIMRKYIDMGIAEELLDSGAFSLWD